MKKSLLPLLIAAVLTLSACHDKNKQAEALTQQLQVSEQTIRQLKSELEQAQAEIDKLRNNIPVLNTTVVELMNKQKTFNLPGKTADETQTSKIDYNIVVTETGINWLDQLLYQNLIFKPEGDTAKLKEINAIADAKQRYLALLDYDYSLTAAEAEKGNITTEEYKLNLDYVGQRHNILTFVKQSYNYSGGAHGAYSTDYINIDINKKAIIGLDDVFPPKTQEKMTALLWAAYQQRNGNENKENYASLDELKSVTPSVSFYFNAEGITFVYPLYSLGPYVDGEVELTLYWNQNEITEIINPAYTWKATSNF